MEVRLDHFPCDPREVTDERPSLDQTGFQTLLSIVEKEVMGKKGYDQAGHHPQAQMKPIELSRKDNPIQEEK
jgi:hypothetical protein